VFSSLVSQAQLNDTLWNFPPGYLVETVRGTYDDLSHEGMKTGLLLNRGMVFTDYTEEWHNGNPVMASSFDWYGLYNGIKDSDMEGVLENGYNMGEMDAMLLKKIEELTLYVTEQQKEIDELKKKQ